MDKNELLKQGFKYLQTGNIVLAKECFEAVIETDANNAEAYFGLGCTYTKENEIDMAIVNSRKAVAINPNHSNAYNGLGVLLNGKGAVEEAEQCYRRAIAVNPNHSNAYNGLGVLLNGKGAVEEAEQCYRRAIAVNPNHSNAYYNLGVLFKEKDAVEEAEQCFRGAIAVNPNHSNAYYNLGVLFKEKGAVEEAEQCYRRAIAVNPNHSNAYNGLGVLFKEKGALEEAEQCYRRAIAVNPNHSNAYNGLGVLLKDKGAVEEAEQCYRKAIAVNPNNSDAYNNLGVLLKDKGAVEEAEQCYRKAIAVNPNNSDAYNNLGNLLKDKDAIVEAEQCYRRAIAVNPNNSDAYNNLGNLLKDKDAIVEAEQCYRKAIAVNPNYSNAYNGLGSIYLSIDQKKAFEYFTTAILFNYNSLAAFMNRSGINIEINPNRARDFNRSIYLLFLFKRPKHLVAFLNRAMKLDMPLVVYRIAAVLPLYQWKYFESYSTDIHESFNQTQSFRRLIMVWQLEKKIPKNSLLAEAIINYYLGDVPNAFNIFNDEIDIDEVGLNLCGQYYFCLAANEVMEEEEAILRSAVKQVDSILTSNKEFSDSEKYYAGLIYYLSGDFDEAIAMLQSLFPRFVPAGYKLAEIYEALYVSEQDVEDKGFGNAMLQSPEARRIMNELHVIESNQPLYAFGIEPIAPRHDEEHFLEDIMLVVHFMEVHRMLAYIFVKPSDIRRAFYNAIQLNDIDDKKESLSLKNKAAKAWQQIIEKELDKAQLDDLYNGYSHFEHPNVLLGELIQYGAKAELFDAQQKHRQPVQFDFKLYLALNFKLYQNGSITLEQASCINDYMYACMEALPVFKENEAKQYLLNCVKDFFLEDNIPYIGYGQKLVALLQIIHKQTKGKESPIINFKEFDTLYKELAYGNE